MKYVYENMCMCMKYVYEICVSSVYEYVYEICV
jgi:hypothetical protein